jgi:hypothetical protein
MAGPRKKTEESGAVAVAEVVEESTTVKTSPNGLPLTKSGELDKRFKFAPGTRPARASSGLPAGQARVAAMKELLGDKNWEYVEDGYAADGVLSVTGAKLKKFYVIRNTDTSETVTVGKGEMTKYAGVDVPRKPRGIAGKKESFDEAFEDSDVIAESEVSSTSEVEDDMAWLDEPES